MWTVKKTAFNSLRRSTTVTRSISWYVSIYQILNQIANVRCSFVWITCGWQPRCKNINGRLFVCNFVSITEVLHWILSGQLFQRRAVEGSNKQKQNKHLSSSLLWDGNSVSKSLNLFRKIHTDGFHFYANKCWLPAFLCPVSVLCITFNQFTKKRENANT